MTRIISIVHIAWLLILVNTGVYAQAPSADPSQDILPPSPSAASITKYVDFPAVSSSGTPSVSVPLGMLGGRGIGIPISLEYHAGGVRVDEVAGIVGLGWSLNAGGVITRTVNGLPDEDDDGFMFRGNDVPTPPIMTTPAYTAMQNFASGAWDSQPDIFQFSFGAYSGKFVFDDASTVRFIPQQDLKVSYTTCTTCPGQLFAGSIISLTITAPDGVQYLFGTESAVEYSTTGSYFVGGSASCTGKTYSSPAATAWYLKSITNPRTADLITFNYNTNRIYYDLSYNESYSYPAPGNYVGEPSCPSNTSVSKCVTTKTDNGVILSSIVSSEGKVEFVSSSTRSDVTVQLGQYRLDTVKFYGKENILLKSYRLVQTFVQSSGSTPSTAGTSTYRMYLDEVKQFSAIGALINTQTFEYHNRALFPPRMSHKQDAWGYFNNKNNTQSTPAPDNSLPVLQYIQTYHPSFSPANRTPDPNYAWYSVLKKVTFPTGGSAEYEYESNQLPVCDSINIPSNALTSEAVNFTGTPQTKTKDFYLPSDQWVQINYYVLMNGFRCDGASSKITALDAGNPFTGLTWGGCAQMVSPIELQGSVSWFLKAGNYRLEVKVFQGPESGYPPPFSTSPESATLAVQYVSYTPSFIVNEVTGGIRVKKITLSDGLSPNHSPNIVKAYKYHKADQGSCPDASSGYYMGRYARYLTQDYSIIDPSGNIACDYELCRYFRITSSSMTNLAASNGTIVSYREMWVLDGANGENGRQYLKHEIFQDGNSQSGPNYYAIFLNTPTVDYSWKNGKLVEEKFINSQNQTVQQNLYEYEFNETAGKVSLKAMLARKIFEPYCPNSFMFTCDGVNNEPEEYNIVYDMCGLPEHMCNIAYTWYSPCYNQPAGTVINNSTYALNPYAIEWYDVISQFVYLKKKIERAYDPNGSANYVETVTDYQYDLPSLRHHMPVKSIVTNSDGAQYATRTVYPPEYNTSTVSGTTATAIRDLKDNYIINAPVEIVQTLKKSGQTEKVTGAQLIKYKNFSGTRILPNELWQLGTTSALSDFIWSTISGDGTFGNDSRYYQTRVLGNYDTNGNLLEWHKTDDQVSSFLYWNGTAAAVAYARNALPSEIAYTGFESPGQMSAAHNGNWTISGTNTAADWNTATGYYHTGKTGYKVGTAHSITRSGLPSGNYVVSFFYRDGQVKVNGTTIGAAATSNWQYAETTVNIPGGTATITGAVSAAYIDELRLHPADALMRTIAPDNNSLLPLSMSEENSVPVHYEYDNLQRLQSIRDQDRNIVQTYEYNYQQAGTALNDIKARTVLTSGQTTVAQVNVLTGANVRRIFQYMDGLGRPIQANEIGQSQAQNDIVTPQIYDAYGREAKKYLPYTYTTNSGAYRSTALSEQNTFINGFGAGGYGFSEQSFEASPLNRVVEQSAPGATWRTGQATRKFVYRTNTSGDAVRDLSNTGTLFAANTLNVSEETDENNRKKIIFTDKLGRTVLVKQQVVETPANPPGNYDYTLTYTAYDDFGRPVAVIPPEATKKMITLNNWNHFFTGYSAMTYRYTYDSRGRMVTKSIPTGGTTSIWYDRLDRPVLTQDAKGFKAFIRYDILSRPVVSGKYKGTSTPGVSEPLYETPNTTAAAHYYTGVTFPTDNNIDYYKIFYYDDYDLDNNGSLAANETYTNPGDSGYETAAFTRTRGKATAAKTAILPNDDSTPTIFLITRTYYDKEYSVIQINKQNHLGGADIISSVYDFANRLTKTRREHTATPPGGTLKTYVIREEYTLDHAGRVRFTRHHIATTTTPNPTSGWVVTSAPVYDELGRLVDKRLHASNYDGSSAITTSSNFNYLQSLDYTYNIRSWLTGLNDMANCNVQAGDQLADLLKMQLSYDVPTGGGTAQFNGNISTMQWRTYINSTCSPQHQYRFTYDPLNRLTAADHYTNSSGSWTFTNNYSESGITYDLNGNLKTYTRRGLTVAPTTYGIIDQLTYTYSDGARPDKLSQIGDAGSATKGFKFTTGAASYGYDSNGNMTLDNHKSLTINYNFLNLPRTFTSGANTMTVTYTADGEKLGKTVSGVTKNYVSGIEYSGSNLEAIYHADGRCTLNTATTFYYEYTLKDHLGNARVHWRAITNGTAIQVLQENQYYPFGMEQEGSWTPQVGTENQYQYNGKEFNEDLGVNWYDYGARWYDPAVGRWWSVDPMGEKYVGWSPYNYVLNNPLINTDPNGESVDQVDPSDLIKKDDEKGTHFHQQLIDDLYEKTGVTIIVEDGKWSPSEIDETKGSKTARKNLLDAINSDETVQILDNRGKGNEVPTNPDGTHTNIINLDGYDIQYFIDNTFGMDNTTNGFAMTFMHELQHTNAMGGREDTNKYGSKGIVVRIVNDMLRELGLNERESYQAMDAGPNQNVFIPYSKEVKKNIEKGIPPQDDQPHIRINKLKAAGGRI